MPEYQLNEAQLAAVKHTAGPLLIVAGAGTGKTTVIVNKIAHLIETKQARPEQILALTFNDKAALEIQERVDFLINTTYSDLTVSTFHAFCQRALEQHAIDIGFSNNFKLLTETAAWILMRRNLAKFNLNYYRSLGNPAKHIYELLRHFSKCKDELITPEEYLAQAEAENLATGDMNIAERSRISELANAFHVYNKLLRDSALSDFGDLIFYAYKLFSERSAILKKFQDRYRYILVDEFQDVNWAQYQLIKLLANNHLTVVGDDDQSIYAFRGASVSNILHFKSDFPAATEIVLAENYRSGQQILDTAYASIQNNNPDRLEIKLKIDKKLRAGNKRITASVRRLHGENGEAEARLVAEEILKIKLEDEEICWDDFAILVRANNHAEPFMAQLEARGVPYEFLSSSGLYRQPVILDAINFFKAVDNEYDSAAIYRLLGLPFIHTSESDLQKLIYFCKKKTISFYEALRLPAEAGLSAEGLIIGNQLLEWLNNARRQSRYQKPSIALYSFLEKSGYLQYLAHEEERGNLAVIRQIYHLKQFFDYLAEYETITPEARLADFLEHFMLVLESGDRGALYQPGETPDSVNILTVHAAKGLEFKYVFIVNLVEERFPTRRRGEGIEIPAALIKEQLPEGDSHLEEERRLFYVAMTRAKERLYFTSASDYGGQRRKKISRFLAELGYDHPEPASIRASIPVQKETAVAIGSFAYELPQTFSFSQIRAYETCPYRYKLAHILHLPAKGNASFSFGQTMHATLQAFYQKIKELNHSEQASLFVSSVGSETVIKAPPLDDLFKLYEEHWIGDWYQSRDQREDYYKKGREILKIFYQAQENSWTIPANLESWFKIKTGKYFLHGRIDRIDKQADGTLEIIDYKTGQAKDKLAADDKEQLLIYQIAVEELPEYNQQGKTGKLTFYYLNDNKKVSFLGEGKELEKLKNKIIGIADRIQARDFSATPSQFACGHCDFKDICDYRV